MYPSTLSIWGQAGLLSGQTVEWSGPQYCGKAGMLRVWIEELYQYGLAVAWLDPLGCIEPDSFITMSEDRFWMVRPSSGDEALACAEMIIRSGCFDIVVFEHPSNVELNTIRRIQRLAKRHDLVLVWSHHDVDRPLSGQVAHRVHVSGVPSSRREGLSEWSAMQLKVCAKNIKTNQPRTVQTEMYLHEAATLSIALTKEYPDRRSQATSLEAGMGSMDV